MSYAGQMLDIYPGNVDVDAAALASTIDRLIECAQARTADADADLGEQCIRLRLDCADVCAATTRVVSRQTEYDASVTGPLSKRAPPPAEAAVTHASGTPRCSGTAACAPRPAAAASRPAGISWPP